MPRGHRSGVDRWEMEAAHPPQSDSLRQMMEDGLAYRHDYQESPPRVEYGLTELGREMLPIIDALAEFGTYYQSVVKP